MRDLRHGAEPALMRLLPGVAPALRVLGGAGHALLVVTNQSGVARGLFSSDESLAMGRRLAALVAAAGPQLAAYHLAPDAPEKMPSDDSDNPGGGLSATGLPPLRKPSPRMLLEAAETLHLDLARSWMVGDALSDLEAGLAAGARAILLDTGALAWPEAAELPAILRDPRVRIARNLAHAAALILAADPSDTRVDMQSIPLDLRTPLLPETLLRGAPPADLRGPGEPSLWPDAERMMQAGVDGLRLGFALLPAHPPPHPPAPSPTRGEGEIGSAPG